MEKRILALIPARGGSKGLKDKNILKLNNKPLISYTIEAALKSKYIDDVIISTDSKEIAKIAEKAGAENPFMRPDYLATDTATTYDVLIYTLNELEKRYNRKYDIIVLLQPTSPLRDTKDIENAIELYNKKQALSVISVKKSDTPIEWYRKVNENLFLSEITNKAEFTGRQSYEQLYLPNGAIYVFDVKQLLNEGLFYTNKTYAYIMNKEKSIDIDDIYDFMLVEAIIKKNMENNYE